LAQVNIHISVFCHQAAEAASEKRKKENKRVEKFTRWAQKNIRNTQIFE